jgi:hypothetical protein
VCVSVCVCVPVCVSVCVYECVSAAGGARVSVPRVRVETLHAGHCGTASTRNPRRRT